LRSGDERNPYSPGILRKAFAHVDNSADLASIPGAFMAIDISDSGLTGTDPTPIQFVRNGGILMTRAWFDGNNEQEDVISIYKAALPFQLKTPRVKP
jgi:hypothetical protein